MYTVNEIIDRHYPQVSNKPWLSAPLKFCLKKLLHEKDIQQFKQDYPHCDGLVLLDLNYMKDKKRQRYLPETVQKTNAA